VGGLVQPPPAARAHRQRTAGRSRSALLRSEGGTCPSRVIQAKTPPRNPARFISAGGHIGFMPNEHRSCVVADQIPAVAAWAFIELPRFLHDDSAPGILSSPSRAPKISRGVIRFPAD